MKTIFIFTLLLLGSYCFSQEIDEADITIYQASEYSVMYQAGKYSIHRQISPYALADSLELKQFLCQNGIEEEEIRKNPAISFPHFWVVQNQKIGTDLFKNRIIYFVGDRPEAMESISFTSIESAKLSDINHTLLQYILERKQVTRQLLTNVNFPFVGRYIKMEESWQWDSVNVLKEPETSSKMNWSLHKTLQEAIEETENRLKTAYYAVTNEPYKDFEILSEEIIPMYFENIPTKVKKTIINEIETSPILKNYRKERKLIVYSVAQKVREKYVACSLSFYESEDYKEHQLTPLLAAFLRF